MCPKCKECGYDCAMGRCEDCSAETTSMAFKLCDRCAIVRKVCKVCKKSI